MLTCAAIAAAVMAATPGQVVTLAPGQDCGGVTVRARQWAEPVTLRMEGASIRHLTLDGVQGLVVAGGTFKPELEGGLRGRGVTVRGKSGRLVFRGGLYLDCIKCLAIGAGISDVLVERNEFQPLQDGVTFAGAPGQPSSRIVVRDNHMHNFRPKPTECQPLTGEVVPGLSKRACEARGGTWTDGHHPDGVQFWGPGVSDIIIERNRIEGEVQGITQFGSVQGVPPVRVRIADNFIRVSTGWGIAAQGVQDLVLTGNDVGRMPGSTRKVQISVIGSTGTICGNKNPDARAGDVTVKPC